MKKNVERNQSEIGLRDEKISYYSQWVTCGMCFFAHVSLLLMFYFCSIKPLLYYNIGSVTFYILLFFYLAECPKNRREYATEAAAVEIMIHQILCMHLLGVESGFQQILIPTAAYMLLYSAASKRKLRTNIILATICITIYGIACIGLRNSKPQYELPENVEKLVYTIISMFSFAVLIAVVWILSYLRNQGYRELKQKNIELEKLAKTKSDFLSSMSHEIRTPLNVVIGMTELTLQEEISGQARENLEYIRNSGKNLLSIINDILDLSKMESGKMKIMEGDYSLKNMLKEVIALMEVKAKEQKIALSVEIDENLPEILWGDETRLRQVLTNLVGNAIKFTKEGYVLLKVKHVVEGDSCHITFEVKDSGVGIKKSDIDRIFNEFEQVDSVQDHNKKGSGLGLSISKNLVSLMGGNLMVDSTYGKGSNFYFTIIQKILHLSGKNDNKKEILQFTTERTKVLVVDDNKANLKIAESYLKLYNIDIDLAEDGFEAVDRVEMNQYDLILMDYMMPQIDGLETMQKIRELEQDICKNIPIIALTADIMDENREMLIEKGFQDVMIKPIQGDILAEVLKRWLPQDKIIIHN